MEKIYECTKCGAHHRALDYLNTTQEISNISSESYSIYYCPTCKQASSLEEIDYMSTSLDKRFWPYHLDKNEILDQYPAMKKWLET